MASDQYELGPATAPNSYNAMAVWGSVPDSIKQKDSQNGYPLFWLIYAAVKPLDDLGVLFRDDMAVTVTSATDTLGNVTYEQTYGVDHVGQPNSPGWSQILDIDRCPEYALPWLAQFVGVRLLPGSTLNLVEKQTKITDRSSFQRGTVASIKNVLTTLANASLAPGQSPMLVSQVIVAEGLAYTGGSPLYTPDENAVVILLPNGYFPSLTYGSVDTVGDYAVIDATYVTYGGIVAVGPPSLVSAYIATLYRFRPAGLQLYIGVY